MEHQEAELALREIADLGMDTQVHLTGGEPFLNFPLLLHTTETAVRLGIVVYAETNAGWCTDQHLVNDRFQRLRDAGLAAILISCTPFHAETIPLRRTLMAIDIALRIFGPQRVLVYQSQWIEHLWRFGSQAPVPVERHIEAFGLEPAALMLWDSVGMISGGRAGIRLGYLAPRHSMPEAFSSENCRMELLHSAHSHLDLYSGFIPGFCGGISLGDWHDLSGLFERYKNQSYPELIQILIQRGPFGLFEEALGLGFTPFREGYAGKCHLCMDVRRFLKRVNRYPELQPANYYQMI
jgi:hypothetical protein